MRRPSPLAILAALALAASAALSPARAALPAPSDGQGLHVESFQQLDARQLAVRVSTDALQHPVDLRILLPAGYEGGTRRYPVLYLFHGTSGRASDWVNFGRAVETTADLPLIVVMPDAGFNGDGGGWFADWYNAGAFGPPMWETFHIEQVVPWVDANLRTVAKRTGRAIAGLSQGGFGALSYAARHPDLFTSVASFSGGCVIDRDPQAIQVSTAIIQYTVTVLSGVADQDAVFGPRATQEINWQAHDPGTLVENFRGMQIGLWTGNGDPGPFDPDPPNPGAGSIEMITFGATQLFHGYLQEVRIKHAYNYYGPGTHIFPYWARDLEEYVRPLMRRFRNSPKRPRSVDYLSADDRWEQWGWTVELDRAERAFSRLRRASKRGFLLTGTGRATVQTPAVYTPGASLRVVRRGGASETLTADGDGRLPIEVPLGATEETARVSIRGSSAAY